MWLGRYPPPENQELHVEGNHVTQIMKTLFLLAILSWSLAADAAPGSYSGNIEMDGGSGDPGILGYLLLAGLVPPALSKLFTIGPWKDDSWLEVGFTGVLNAFVLVMAIQVAVVAIVVIPVYFAFKLFSK
jgi:hypothetical protein